MSQEDLHTTAQDDPARARTLLKGAYPEWNPLFLSSLWRASPPAASAHRNPFAFSSFPDFTTWDGHIALRQSQFLRLAGRRPHTTSADVMDAVAALRAQVQDVEQDYGWATANKYVSLVGIAARTAGSIPDMPDPHLIRLARTLLDQDRGGQRSRGRKRSGRSNNGGGGGGGKGGGKSADSGARASTSSTRSAATQQPSPSRSSSASTPASNPAT